MAWVAPITFVAGTPPTAAEINSMLYTNMLETMPGLATQRGQFFVTSGVNSIVARTIGQDNRTSADGPITVTSTSYGNGTGAISHALCTVTVTTGISALAIWNSQANISHSTDSNQKGFTSVAITGDTTVAASDNYAQSIEVDSTEPFGVFGASMPGSLMAHYFTGLTAGSNTFTLKYRVRVAGEGFDTFYGQSLAVIPF